MAKEIQALIERLNREDVVGFNDFQRILARLLSDTIILAEDSQAEAELYDKALLVRSDLAEVLALFGLTLAHSDRLRYFRIYPPGATSPEAPKRGDTERGESTLFRRPLGPGVGALLFVLRLIYAQGLLEGRVVKGAYVMTDLGQINITLKNTTGRDPLPAVQRQAAFRELANLWRVIRFDAKASLSEATTQILIHPIICDVISNERAQAALDALGADDSEEEKGGGSVQKTEHTEG